ncbi:hypothetical protein FRC03_006902 [Tulasnella sp. 419]|nr:hypothetical protein FRC03_006902 [Tulasnella sp. 419]
MANVSYYLVPYDDLETAMQIESVGFHPDEAATLQSFQYRQKQAPELFLGAYSEENVPSTSPSNPLSPRELVGYVVSTIARDDTLKHEAMSHHVPASEGGVSVCIHSVCVRPDWRKKGVALGLLKEYVKRLEDGDQRLRRILLICHDDTVELYKKAGFELVGKSSVVHGPREWFEMKYELKREADTNEGGIREQMPPGLLEALCRSTPRKRKTPQRISAFHSITELVSDDHSSGTQSNKYKLACPRQGCGSVILLPGVAKLVESASVGVSERKQ